VAYHTTNQVELKPQGSFTGLYTYLQATVQGLAGWHLLMLCVSLLSSRPRISTTSQCLQKFFIIKNGHSFFAAALARVMHQTSGHS